MGPLASQVLLTILGLCHITADLARGQAVDVENRPVADIQIEGLKRVDAQLVYNQIRMKKGDPYDKRVVEQDIERITHLNQFAYIEARVDPQADGSVVLVYGVREQNLVTDVHVVGNKDVTDQELLDAIRLRAGDPLDSFLVNRALKQIVQTYAENGYFDTTVTIDEDLKNESGILLFRVVEGPRRRIRAIRFQGNQVFTGKQLRSKIGSKTYIPILRKGELSRPRSEEDAARLRQFYHERGYLDADAYPQIDISPDGRDVIVNFIIEEGGQYTVAQIEVQNNEIYSDAAIIEAMSLRVGDVYSQDRRNKSRKSLIDKYGQLGHIESTVSIEPLFREDKPYQCDVLVKVVEGKPYWVGTIRIKGNQLTKDTVITRQMRDLRPGRRFVGPGIEKTKKRLNESPLFSRNESEVTILGNVDDDVRDVLIEVKEKNTGSIGFGAGVSSDSGIVGAFDVTQRNFDLYDVPESPAELFTGQAFRGAGQFMRIALQPGNVASRYLINFKEPYLLDSNIFLDTTASFFDRERDDYDEERLGGRFNLGQRFGDVWSALIRTRYEFVDITDINRDAAVDVFDVQGKSQISSLGFLVSRNDVDSRFMPTTGSRLQFGVGRAGALGGDFDFTKVTSEIRRFWTVDEDFFGRRTVLSARARVGYIIEDNKSPLFERFYAGGHRTLRGFKFRGVSPRSDRFDVNDRDNDGNTAERIKGDDPVGGDWMLLFGFEYNVPVYQEVLRWVLFVDSGTVDKRLDLSNYRASIGTGIRVAVPFLGPTPFALDVAVPVLKEEEDDKRIFSFDLAIPF